MKKDFASLINRNAARDSQAAAMPHGIDSRIGGDTYAPRDITKPITGLAREIDLDHVEADRNQPRKTMDEQSLHELAQSIRENGVLQPITVSHAGESDRYTVIAGHRRTAAARLAGLTSIPAIIRPDDYNEQRRLQEQLVENLQREDIPAIEEARALQTFLETSGLSQRKGAERLGKNLTYLTERLHILQLPDDLLNRASQLQPSLPVHALIGLSRMGDPTEQRRAFEAALKSETPFQEVKKARDRIRPKERLKQFHLRYQSSRFFATGQVTFDKHPEDVPAEDVVKFLTEWIQDLLRK